MTPYIGTFFMLALLSFTQFTKELKKYKLLFFIFASLYLVAFAGLREVGVGTDDFNYFNLFKDMSNLFDFNFMSINDYRKEYGFIFLTTVIKSFSDNYYIYFLMISFIAVGINSFHYNKYSKYVILSLLLYFVHTFLYRDMNQIRAGIAAAIGLFTIAQIHKREHIKVYFTLFVASLFHIAVLSLFIPYIVSFLKVNKTKSLFIVLLGFILGLISISSIIVGLLPPDLSSVTKSINNYAEAASYNRDLGLFNITNIKTLFIYLTLFLFYEKLEKRVPYFATMFMFYSLALSWRFAFSDFAILSGRIATFFEIVEVILIPSLILIFRQKTLIFVLIIIYAFSIFYLNMFIVNRNPYQISIF